MSKPPYPWQSKQWFNVQQQIQQNRLPHALLLTGNLGMGQFDFALLLAQQLLCEKQTACGQCTTCLLFLANTHPDIQIIEAEEESSIIKIDQVRTLINFMNQTSVQAGYKIVIIHPACQMNLAASNALLKVLEEPPLNQNLIMLITEQASRLLPTIKSRCQTLSFLSDERQLADQWLKEQSSEQNADSIVLELAEFAPLQVLKYLKEDKAKQVEMLIQHFIDLGLKNTDPVSIATFYKEYELPEILHLLYFLITYLIRYKLNIQDDLLYDKLGPLASKLTIEKLFSLQDFVIQTNSELSRKINLNGQLVLEKIFCSL
ncbi:MAG: DNA polymerase III subunit delta' [Gammaproteobacteria bacterium]